MRFEFVRVEFAYAEAVGGGEEDGVEVVEEGEGGEVVLSGGRKGLLVGRDGMGWDWMGMGMGRGGIEDRVGRGRELIAYIDVVTGGSALHCDAFEAREFLGEL